MCDPQDSEGVAAQLNEVEEEYNMYKDVVRGDRTKKSALQECEGDMGTIEAQKKVCVANRARARGRSN